MEIFVNKYNKDFHFYYSQQFDNFIFAIGEMEGVALIVQTDLAGNYLWGNRYHIDSRDTVIAQKIIQIDPDLFVVYITNEANDIHFLLAIDESGNPVWTREIYAEYNPSRILIESYGGGGFWLVESPFSFDSFYPFKFGIIDSSGSRLFTYYIPDKELIVKDIAPIHNGGGPQITLACTDSEGNGRIVVFDEHRYAAGEDLLIFKLGTEYEEEPFPIDIQDILLNESSNEGISLYLLGRLPEYNNQFFFSSLYLHFTDDGSYPPNPNSLQIISDYGDCLFKLCPGYLCQYYPYDFISAVHLWDFPSMQLQWSKTLSFDPVGLRDDFTIRRVNSYFEWLTFNLHADSILAHTYLEMESCLTVDTDPIEIEEIQEYFAWATELIIEETGIELSVVDVGVEELFSEVEELCPGPPDPPDPPDPPAIIISITDKTILQSPYTLLMAAGSKGSDGSAAGIHLRWIFDGVLGEKHLPKGNSALTTHNFNKPDDFVRILRSPYAAAKTTLNLTSAPRLADGGQARWLYQSGGKNIYLRFGNKQKYDTTAQNIDPLTAASDFIAAYGSEQVEIEPVSDTFFTVTLGITNYSGASYLEIETLSEQGFTSGQKRIVSSRKKYTGNELQNVRLLCENGKSVRYRIYNANVGSIAFEFYREAITKANTNKSWTELGKYALSTADTLVFSRLEPQAGQVHGKWPRYNNGGYVNINNYKNRWNRQITESSDRNISQIVAKYIENSNNADNPKAMDKYVNEEDSPLISLLDLLKMGACDYHLARMLGLGTLDYTPQIISGQGNYIYLLEYYTYGDLEDGSVAGQKQHLYLSLPVSVNDARLPLPVDIKSIVPGILNDTAQPADSEEMNLIGNDGYTYDGRNRFVTLQATDEFEYEVNPPFFSGSEFEAAQFTLPVYAGVNYKKDDESGWRKPEPAYDSDYLNAVPSGQTPFYETVPFIVSENKRIIYIHKQDESGTYQYRGYGVNLFSRTTESSTISSIITQLTPANLLKYPSNIRTCLIRKEKPLLLTSQTDQDRLDRLITDGAPDKTLVRLTFDYYAYQDMARYQVDSKYDAYTDLQLEQNTTLYPDDELLYAQEVEVFFREKMPASVSGKVAAVYDDPADPFLAVIETNTYELTSTEEQLIPALPADISPNYEGGIFSMGDEQYIVHSIQPSSTKPVIWVYKKEASQMLMSEDTEALSSTGKLSSPSPETYNGLFTVYENMQNINNWGSFNPHPFKIQIGTPGWTINREVIRETVNGANVRILEKTRGFRETGSIAEYDPSTGTYKIAFDNFILPQNTAQHEDVDSVEWYNGYVRLQRESGEKASFEVIAMERSAVNNSLILYFVDPTLPQTEDNEYDKVATVSQNITYYPGYKVYLYASTAQHLTEKNLLPAPGEGVRYSIIGLRTHKYDNTTADNYYSKISVPAPMFAQELTEPEQPELPLGAAYTTRPDTFGKASYTFATTFAHKPDNILFCRSNNEAVLNALYEPDTVRYIKESLELLGGTNEVYLGNRWENFFDFEALRGEGQYGRFPDDETGFAFPVPDKTAFIESINSYIDWFNTYYHQSISQPENIVSLSQNITPSSVDSPALALIDFVKNAVHNTFVPLTEFSVIYKYINDYSYTPVPVKQQLRDRNGYLLSPSSGSDFRPAPMAKLGENNPLEVWFTDFSIDGTSRNIYFYSVREMNAQMQMGEYSPVLGPVKPVSTNPPSAPEIKRVMPVLENSVLGIVPGVQFEINAYPKEEYIRKITIYRAFEPVDAVSVRSMAKVKEIDLEDAGILDNAVWVFTDEFDDLPEVPYGDPLYYRITVSRKVEYAGYPSNEVITEYAPSLQSKLLATLIVESESPEAPLMDYTSGTDASGNLTNVVLSWNKTAYKGTYYLYKMNANGNWVKIYQISTNEDTISVALAATDWGDATLPKTNTDGAVIYHHFKVVADNTAGMFSTQENILTI